jgi:hypothetical protein
LAGSGKSTVARWLIKNHAYVRLAFASTLKDMLRVAGFTEEQLEGSEKEVQIPELGKSPRQIMQLMGTDFAREMVHTDFWTQAWSRRLPGTLAFSGRVVADDVRFTNEVEAIWALGGRVFRVERPGIEAMAHKSEGQPLVVDGVIYNHGSLRDLELNADYVAMGLNAERLASAR